MSRLHSSHGWDHVERVANLAEHIATSEEEADVFIVKTAAVLHDIARIDEVESGGRTCHAERGSRMAYDFLITQGLEADRADQIRRCVLAHRYRNEHAPKTIEAKILYDADKLDSIGAVGIGRAFLFSGEVGARLHNPDIDINLTQAYSKEDTAYREYMVKLRHISGKMLTAGGRRMAEERHRFMVEFFERLQREVRGDL
ncbi:MAG: HD domain-containing protein [Spirochaetes bacterium]|nr:HD domain-containing protein [Spirochaetota bacterium]